MTKEPKITDRHRAVVLDYYAMLGRKHGFEAMLRRIPMLSRIVWNLRGLRMVEERLAA